MRIDSTTGTNDKVDAVADYFRSASPDDAAWALYDLTGRRLKRFISTKSLRDWTLHLTGLSLWLYEKSCASVGDTAECCALLLDSQTHIPQTAEEPDRSLASWMTEPEQKEHVITWWNALDRHGIFVVNKLLTGVFCVGVSQSLVARALGGGFTREQVASEVRSADAFKNLSDADLDWALMFITIGGKSLKAYPNFRRVAIQDGVYKVVDSLIARTHRMSIGTIQSDASVKLKFQDGREMGTVEESHDESETETDQFIWMGHIHPVATLKASGDRLRLPCFVVESHRGLLPAFSAFTGGVSVGRSSEGKRVFAIAETSVIEV